MPVSVYMKGAGEACRDEEAIRSVERWRGGKLVADKVISVPLSGLGETDFPLTDTFTQTPPTQESCHALSSSQMFARELLIILFMQLLAKSNQSDGFPCKPSVKARLLV